MDHKIISNRAFHWQAFEQQVFDHIENYTVPQYGDLGEDLASDYSVQDCLNQVTKYIKRHGRNSREGQDKLDMLKAAHYLQMAWSKME